MWKPEHPGAAKKIRLRRDLLHPRAVQSNSGGVLGNGAFRVKVEVFGSDLVYQEGERKLTLPVEFGIAGSCLVNSQSIRRWDDAPVDLDPHQISLIERNIFAALNHLRIRFQNAS